MSTAVSVHILFPARADCTAFEVAPRAVLELFLRYRQPLNYGSGRVWSDPPGPYVAQFPVRGADKIGTGKQLLRELDEMGLDARLHFSGSGAMVWWPEPPSWPTWEWSPERVVQWLAVWATEQGRMTSPGE